MAAADAGGEATGLAADTRVEAVDGPIAVQDLVGKGVPVLTRLASGARGFRLLSRVQPSPVPVPLVRIRLENGHAVTVAARQVLYGIGLVPVRAGEVRRDTGLEPSFHYPAGYRLRGTPAAVSPAGGAVPGGEPCIRVIAVEPAGKGVVYRGAVNETRCLFLTAGILCAE